MTSALNKNVNAILLLLTVFLILTVAALPIYFDYQLSSLKDDYVSARLVIDNLSERLDDAEGSADFYEKEYKRIDKEYNTLRNSFTQYDDLYSETTTELDETKTSCENQKVVMQNRIDDLRTEVSTAQTETAKAISERNQYAKAYSSTKDKLERCESDLEDALNTE